jgi:hypothetical protein
MVQIIKLMKKYLFIVMLTALSCLSLSAQNTQAASSTSKVPKAWLGHWQKGTFSLTSFEEQDGKYVGPANETSISYVIEENGVAREYFITNTNTYNCRMQVLGYREGKLVTSGDNTFEFQPSSGYYYTVSCMNKTKTKKPYGAKDLYPEYSVKLYVVKDDSGAPVLVTKNAKASGELQLKKIK